MRRNLDDAGSADRFLFAPAVGERICPRVLIQLGFADVRELQAVDQRNIVTMSAPGKKEAPSQEKENFFHLDEVGVLGRI